MKVSKQRWAKATENLNERRKSVGHTDDNRRIDNVIRDYKTHLLKGNVGKSVLDVGCGGQFLKKCLPDNVKYIGIDAFPIVEDTVKIAIEDLGGAIEVDTVCAFAVLDNCRDFFKACENIKRSARKNVIILTGIGIDVDQYHTFKLELEDFEKAFGDWTCTHKEELTPKVYLLCYQR
jgi:hypothetical protein